jgi:hypothetical protein
VLLAEIRDFDIADLHPELEGWHRRDGSGLSRDTQSPEEEGAVVVNQRQAEKVKQLMQLYSAQDLTGLKAGLRVPPRESGALKP